MTATSTCPVCGKKVTEARDLLGAPVYLSRPSPSGKYLTWVDGDGVLRAKPFTGQGGPGGRRYAGHTCAGRGGGLDRIRARLGEAAAEDRRNRGRQVPGEKGRYRQAIGVRVPPPGGER